MDGMGFPFKQNGIVRDPYGAWGYPGLAFRFCVVITPCEPHSPPLGPGALHLTVTMQACSDYMEHLHFRVRVEDDADAEDGVVLRVETMAGKGDHDRNDDAEPLLGRRLHDAVVRAAALVIPQATKVAREGGGWDYATLRLSDRLAAEAREDVINLAAAVDRARQGKDPGILDYLHFVPDPQEDIGTVTLLPGGALHKLVMW